VQYQKGIPPVVNDPHLIDSFRRDYTAAFGASAIRESYASLGAEDFSTYLDHTRGALVRLGVGIPGRTCDLHSASFDLDESGIETGIAAAAVALLGMIDDLR
jgi:amidohydrolase